MDFVGAFEDVQELLEADLARVVLVVGAHQRFDLHLALRDAETQQRLFHLVGADGLRAVFVERVEVGLDLLAVLAEGRLRFRRSRGTALCRCCGSTCASGCL